MGLGWGQQGPRDTAVGRAAWQELLGWVPHGEGMDVAAPTTVKGLILSQLPGLNVAGRGCSSHSGVSPCPAQPCCKPQLATHGSHHSPGTLPRMSGFSCCLQELISAWTSLISRRFVFFLLATGMRSFGLGVLNVEKLLLGGGHAAVPGTRTVAPLDASVVLRLPPVHIVLLHGPVCPETLVRGGDEAGDGEAARDLGIRDHR